MCPARAQKDALGCVDSAKDKHCANHVTPLCPELLFSSGPRKSTVQVMEKLPTMQLHNSSNIILLAVLILPMSSTNYLVQVYSSLVSLVIRNISNFAFSSPHHNTIQHKLNNQQG
jgi:hypothetical protein